MKAIHWYPGHMAKTRRLIEEKIKLIDIVIEILDARIPYSSKNPEMDKLVFNKEKIIILSKVDMADPKVTQQWTKHYENQGFFVISSNLLDFKELNKIIDLTNQRLADKHAKDIIKGLKKRPVRALIVGIPNVGKSTLINKIAKRNSAKTGDKAGITKAMQWIKVNQDFELLDSPGVLWPKFDDVRVAINLALTGAIKEEILPKDELCIEAIKFMNTHYQKPFFTRYKIDFAIDNDDIQSIVKVIEHIADIRGCKQRNNVYDYDKVYDLVLKDLKSNRICRMTFDHDFN